MVINLSSELNGAQYFNKEVREHVINFCLVDFRFSGVKFM